MASRSALPAREVESIPRRPDQLVGRRLIERLDEHLRRLHLQPAAGRSALHGNRTFFCDQLVTAHLLAFFNPGLHSLRRIEDAFDLPAVRRRFGIRGAPRSTVADAQRLFDPELLRPILDDLKQRANLQPHDARLDEITRQLTAVDGTFFAVAPRIAWAVYNRKSDGGASRRADATPQAGAAPQAGATPQAGAAPQAGATPQAGAAPQAGASRRAGAPLRTGRRGLTTRGNVRAHVHFDILRGVPEQFSLTGGQAAEGDQLRASLRPEHCYVLDRGFQSYDLLDEIIQADSDFVVRLRKSARCTELEPRPLTAADLTAGVTADVLVQIGWRAEPAPRRDETTVARDDRTPRGDEPTSRRDDRMPQCDQATLARDDRTAPLPPLRRVTVAVAERDEPLLLLTSCLDLPAETIALIYQHRWQIELFFRWLKCMAHLEHFYSESPRGMTLQLYVTLIATLLIALETGARPSVYDFSLMSFAISGQAPLEEVLAVAAKRRAERARAAETQRRRKARQAAEKLQG